MLRGAREYRLCVVEVQGRRSLSVRRAVSLR